MAPLTCMQITGAPGGALASIQAMARGYSQSLWAISKTLNLAPNSVKIMLQSKEGKALKAVAKSIGGGAVRVVMLNDWEVDIDGKNYVISGSSAIIALMVLMASSAFPPMPISLALESSLKTTIFCLGLANFFPLSLEASVKEPM